MVLVVSKSAGTVIAKIVITASEGATTRAALTTHGHRWAVRATTTSPARSDGAETSDRDGIDRDRGERSFPSGAVSLRTDSVE